MPDTDFAKELFSGEWDKRPPKTQETETDFAKELFGTPGAPEEAEKPVGGAFYRPMITVGGAKQEPTLAPYGDPSKAYAIPRESEAGMLAQIKASFVDDPLTKVKIFADARGISPSRYRLNPKTKQIEFKDETGAYQREVFELESSKAKSMFAELALDPKLYLGTAGAAIGGTPGAVGGTMLGEGIRKGVGKIAFGEKVNVPQDLLDVGLAGALAFGGEMAGKSIGWGINKYLGRGQGIVGKIVQPLRAEAVPEEKVVQHFITPQEQAKALWLQHIADQHGITLAPHQLYDKEGMTNIWKYLRKHPLTADTVRTFEDNLSRASEDSIQKFIGEMGGTKATATGIGERLQGTATKIIETAEGKRTKLVAKPYSKAFEEADAAGGVKIEPVIKRLDDLIDSYNDGPSRSALERVKKSLLTEGEPVKGTPPGKILDAEGKPVIEGVAGEKAKDIPETDLRKIQKAIFDLNDLIEGTSYEAARIAPSSKKFLNRDLSILKDELLGAIKKVSPTFAKANAKYERLSGPIEKLKSSVIGELTRMRSDTAIAKAPHKLLDLSNMPDAELLTRARTQIEKSDPKLWREMVGGYIRDVYEGLKATEEGKVVNAVGKLQKRLYGSEKQRQIMKAAMGPEDYRKFEDLMTIFQRAAIGTGKESMTAPFQAIGEKLEPMLGSKAFQFLDKPKKTLLDWSVGVWNDVLMQGRQADLMKIMTKPGVAEQLGELKRLTPGSRRFIEAFSVFSSRVAQEYGQRTP